MNLEVKNIDEALVLDAALDLLLESVAVSEATINYMLQDRNLLGPQNDIEDLKEKAQDCKAILNNANKLKDRLDNLIDEEEGSEKVNTIPPPNWKKNG